MSPRPRNAPPPRAARRAARASAAAPAGGTDWIRRVRAWQVALVLALLHLVLARLAMDPTVHSGGDNAAYLALARSLLERGTYQELWEPAMRHHTQYPPGWPMVLAGAMTLGVKPWVGFKVLVMLFSAAAVFFSYLWARRVSTPGVALAVGVLLAVSPGVVDLARWELSDVPFWAFTMLALWGFARAAALPPAEAAPDERGRWLRRLALASFAVLMAYATRSAGVPLVAAAAAWLGGRRQWRGLALFGAVVGPYAVAWWLRGKLLGGPSYAGHLWYVDPYQPALGTVGVAGMLMRVGRNIYEYTTDHLPYLLVGGRSTPAAMIVGVGVVLLAVAGWALRLRRVGVAELWLPLYMGLVLIWPSEWSGERFVLPVLPMMLVCAAEVLAWGGRRVGRPALLGGAVTAVVIAGGIRKTSEELTLSAECRAAYGPENPFPCLPDEWVDFLGMASAARGQLPEGSAVLSRKPTLFWAQSGYPSHAYPFTPDPDSMIAAAREVGARYVMLDYLDNVSSMYLAPVLMRRPQAFCVVTAAGPGRATLMALRPDAERMPNVSDVPADGEATVAFSFCNRPAPGNAPPPGVP